jgi:fatty acid desaturase
MGITVKEENNQLSKYKGVISRYLSKEEIKQIHEKSDLKGAREVAKVWFWIAFALALVGFFPHPVSIFVALWILAGKQLGCAIILHDCSHQSLFKSKQLNKWVGNWLGAYPTLQNIDQYRPYHLQHHVATGTDDDPDINLTTGYPTTGASMLRKFGRDLIGITGLKAVLGVLMMHLGLLRYNLGNKVEKVPREELSARIILSNAWKNLRGPLAFQVLFFGILWAVGQPLLYLLWWVAYVTTYSFVLRVRSMAEHSMVEDSSNILRNTRTTYANFFERMLFAPLHVNFHNEHHLMVAAPCYNYPKLHQILKERGFYEEALLAPNYKSIVDLAIVSKA